MGYTTAEENFLKAILKYIDSASPDELVSTSILAQELNMTPASITDMAKRLTSKDLVQHTLYKGVRLTDEGRRVALQTLRKHRLWEVFLVEYLKFSWDEVHETAEQLEHIDSPKLIERLDIFLGNPRFDPHGDPIPDEDGNILARDTQVLADLSTGQRGRMAGVLMHTPEFLRYLDRLNLRLNAWLRIIEQIPFDDSRVIEIEGKEFIISSAVTRNVLVIIED